MSAPASRRTFLKTAAGSVLAGGMVPALLQAQSPSDETPRQPGRKADSPSQEHAHGAIKDPAPVLIGEGEFQYECHHNWGQVPEQITWKNTHGVTIDKQGFIYITHQGDQAKPCDTVVVFDPAGQFVRSFGKEYAGGGHGIDIREENGTEYLYLSVNAPHRLIVKCDTTGKVIWKRSAPKEAGVYDAQHAFNPTNVCFGPNNAVFVGDGYGSHYLHEYDKEGNWIRLIGEPGSRPGQLKTPHAQWLDTRGGATPQLVVADRSNNRLQMFSLPGSSQKILQGGNAAKKTPAGTITQQESISGQAVPVTSVPGLLLPAGVDIQGDLMLVADLGARVLIFQGIDNQLVANLGYDEAWTAQVMEGKPFKMRTRPETWQAGKFIHPHDACFDRAGNIFVTEWVDQGRVTFLKKV